MEPKGHQRANELDWIDGLAGHFGPAAASPFLESKIMARLDREMAEPSLPQLSGFQLRLRVGLAAVFIVANIFTLTIIASRYPAASDTQEQNLADAYFSHETELFD